MIMQACNISTEEVEQKDHKFKASLDYVRLCLKEMGAERGGGRVEGKKVFSFAGSPPPPKTRRKEREGQGFEYHTVATSYR